MEIAEVLKELVWFAAAFTVCLIVIHFIECIFVLLLFLYDLRREIKRAKDKTHTAQASKV